MTQTLDIRRATLLPAPPEQVWETIATGSGNLRWLFEMEVEPRVGGTVSRGPCTVTSWEPPHRFSCIHRSAELSAALEYRIEARDSGSLMHTWIHREYARPIDDFALQLDVAEKHTDFYNHTLDQYLRFFNGRPATFGEYVGPKTSQKADAFATLRRELGLRDDVVEGDAVHLDLPGIGQLDAVVDYLRPAFLGLRTADGLYRFFGRNAWGWSVGFSLHLFTSGIDSDKTTQDWRTWLNGIFSEPENPAGPHVTPSIRE